MKPCAKCGAVDRYEGRGGCKPCARQRSTAWYAANRDRALDRAKAKRGADGARVTRGKRLRREYGMTVDEWDALVLDQFGLCALCRQHVGDGLVVDHCHRAGHVRGLLCAKCNCGLGQFDDDPQRLESAANYLRRAA